MSLTTVAELRTALGVGTLYADATLQEVCDAADNVLLPFIWANTTALIGHSNTTNTGTTYFQDPVIDVFYVGQSVVISGSGSITMAIKLLPKLASTQSLTPFPETIIPLLLTIQLILLAW